MESLVQLLEPLTKDARLGAVHISFYVALLQCREAQGGAGPIFLDRKEVMRLARIQGKTTYYKVLQELVEYGVVQYRPCRDRWRYSRINF